MRNLLQFISGKETRNLPAIFSMKVTVKKVCRLSVIRFFKSRNDKPFGHKEKIPGYMIKINTGSLHYTL